MATTLRLSTLANTVSPRPARRATLSAQQFQQLAADWRALDGTAKSSWSLLAQQTANALQPQAAPAYVNAYSAFVAANTVLLNTGQAALAMAPETHVVPPALPALTLTATFGHLGLSVHLSAATAYAGPVLLYATRPQLVGNSLYATTRFVLIGSVPSLSNADITALFQTKFHLPSAGYQIALKAAPVSATGYRRSPVVVSALVTAVAEGGLTLK
jgi:hypothetical protein